MIPSYSTNTPDRDTDFISVTYQHTAFSEGLIARLFTSWSLHTAADVSVLDDLGTPIADLRPTSTRYMTVLRTPQGVLLKIIFQRATHHLTIEVAAKTHKETKKLYETIRKLLPERPRLSEKQEVHVSFWSLSPNGARVIERTIGVNPWAKVEPNYPVATNVQLAKLMVGFKPNKSGQLILWYGPPGTGKTHALRALAWEWRRWCSFHYITDPETFFGHSANYMLDVLLLRSDDVYEDDDESEPAKERWRLLILEDSGELMVPDAKAQAGQGLSRLLNVVDGLIGQGLKIMVLVTTNEVLKKLHPAVQRAGRCAARIEFDEFPRKEAMEWLVTNRAFQGGLTIPPTISLADLYAMTDYGQIVHETKDQTVGFAA